MEAGQGGMADAPARLHESRNTVVSCVSFLALDQCTGTAVVFSLAEVQPPGEAWWLRLLCKLHTGEVLLALWAFTSQPPGAVVQGS